MVTREAGEQQHVVGLTDLPSEIIIEIATWAPLMLRQVLRFDVLLVASLRIQRAYRGWRLAHLYPLAQVEVGDQILVRRYGKGPSSVCFATASARVQGVNGGTIRAQLLGDLGHLDLQEFRVQRLEGWADGPFDVIVGRSTALPAVAAPHEAATNAATTALAAIRFGTSAAKTTLVGQNDFTATEVFNATQEAAKLLQSEAPVVAKAAAEMEARKQQSATQAKVMPILMTAKPTKPWSESVPAMEAAARAKVRLDTLGFEGACHLDDKIALHHALTTTAAHLDSELKLQPTTFALPAQAAAALAHFQRDEGASLWLSKPAQGSRARGIVLLSGFEALRARLLDDQQSAQPCVVFLLSKVEPMLLAHCGSVCLWSLLVRRHARHHQ